MADSWPRISRNVGSTTAKMVTRRGVRSRGGTGKLDETTGAIRAVGLPPAPAWGIESYCLCKKHDGQDKYHGDQEGGEDDRHAAPEDVLFLAGGEGSALG